MIYREGASSPPVSTDIPGSHHGGPVVGGCEQGINPPEYRSNAAAIFGAALGAPGGLKSVGDDANIDVRIVPKGTGAIRDEGPTIEGAAASFVLGGVATLLRMLKRLINLADNTATDCFTVTIPNANHAAMVGITVVGALGDQDSAEASYWTVAISRIAGAATKAVVSAKSSNANTAGVTANAAVTVSVSANAGAVGATQTFTIQIKVARSAGASTNHDALVAAELFNIKATGITIA